MQYRLPSNCCKIVIGPSVRCLFRHNGLILWLTISTQTKILLYKNQWHEKIARYVDTDLAKSPFERLSTFTGGYYILVGGYAASWMSKRKTRNRTRLQDSVQKHDIEPWSWEFANLFGQTINQRFEVYILVKWNLCTIIGLCHISHQI